MPSEHMHQSQPQKRPSLGGHQSTNSITSNTHSDSPSAGTSPHQHSAKPKAQKHVVHHSSSKLHKRVPSNKGLQKLTKVHGNDGSQTDLQSKRNASATNLRKNHSAVSLKRNRSTGEVAKRPKSSSSSKSDRKANTSVHFEIGDTDEGEGAWEEASSSASPALSRAPSRSGQSSSKPSAHSSHPTSPRPQSPLRQQDPTPANGARAHAADAKIITERLLQRTPSNTTTTKMSLATAQPTAAHSPDSDAMDKSATATLNSTPKTGSDVVSRFVGGSGTPKDPSSFLNNPRRSHSKGDEVKRAQSMGNFTHHDNSPTPEEEERPLAPRSRKSSNTHNAYNPPQQSRTQQKLWLQRASSNIEPQQMAPSGMGLGLSLHGGGFGNTPLVGATYDGKDKRIKTQLERTGLEYLVVRRHQDPVGQAIKRLDKLPGADRNRRIPGQSRRGTETSGTGSQGGRYGLSQSLRTTGTSRRDGTSTAAGSFDGDADAASDTASNVRRDGDDESVSAVLRSMWDKSFEFGASAD
ncbi:hypothetical protein GLAREA_01481 [Glarea lozoyensis ATCC 20868]|uniref:TORC1 subunit TCO89 n=1 Tax=Glarea lozoyensis (strain ATCC 20868 / MF5171) TaxID=1116229 RepID=S3CK13_GLAL2|nr:uncharacterized protein GLAREA_01481 [Glarea lozoyensis ATCC 20868]EPE25569.1 hypothetical protein GLAREA_01481 [Glarea lozoyensis ATCC 20868]